MEELEKVDHHFSMLSIFIYRSSYDQRIQIPILIVYCMNFPILVCVYVTLHAYTHTCT